MPDDEIEMIAMNVMMRILYGDDDGNADDVIMRLSRMSEPANDRASVCVGDMQLYINIFFSGPNIVLTPF